MLRTAANIRPFEAEVVWNPPYSASNNASSLQALIDGVVYKGGGTVIIPPGTYVIAATVTIGDGVRLKGASYNTTTLQRAGSLTSGAILDLSNSSNVSIEDLYVDGNGDATNSCIYASNTALETNVRFRRVKTNDGQYGIYLYYADGVTVEQCDIDGAGNGMYLNSVLDCLVDGNRITNTLTGTLDGMGIKIDGSSRGICRGIRVVNNYIYNCDDNGIGMRAMASSVTDVVISNNTIIDSGKVGCKVGVEAADYGTSHLANIIISNNVVRGWGATEAAMGIAIYDYNTNGGQVGVENAVISGNTIESTHTSAADMNEYILAAEWIGGSISDNACYGAGVKLEGIYLTNCSGTSVTGNTVQLAGQNSTANTKGAIQLQDSTYCTVSGNTIRSTGSATAGQIAVYLYYASYNLVSGNFLIDTRATKYMNYGVREAGSPDYNFIDGNYIAGAVTAAVSTSGSNTTSSDNKTV